MKVDEFVSGRLDSPSFPERTVFDDVKLVREIDNYSVVETVKGNTRIFLILNDDNTYKSYIITQISDNKLLLKELYTAKKYRRQGFATMILFAICNVVSPLTIDNDDVLSDDARACILQNVERNMVHILSNGQQLDVKQVKDLFKRVGYVDVELVIENRFTKHWPNDLTGFLSKRIVFESGVKIDGKKYFWY